MFEWIKPPGELDERLLAALKLQSDATDVEVAARLCQLADFATPTQKQTVDLLNRALANFEGLLDEPFDDAGHVALDAHAPNIAFTASTTGRVEDWPVAVKAFYATDLGILGPWLRDPESYLARVIRHGLQDPPDIVAAIQMEFEDAMDHLATVISYAYLDWRYATECG